MVYSLHYVTYIILVVIHKDKVMSVVLVHTPLLHLIMKMNMIQTRYHSLVIMMIKNKNRNIMMMNMTMRMIIKHMSNMRRTTKMEFMINQVLQIYKEILALHLLRMVVLVLVLLLIFPHLNDLNNDIIRNKYRRLCFNDCFSLL